MKRQNNNKDWLLSVYSDGSKFFVSNPLPKKGEEVTIKIQFLQNSPVKKVFLCGKKNGVGYPNPMKKSEEKYGLIYYEANTKVFEDEFKYYFILATEDRLYYYDQEGIKNYYPDESRLFRLITDYTQPSWIKNAVFYQIFPERFCNGNPDISVKDGEYTFDGYPTKQIKDWNAIPEPYEKSMCLDFYGGDLIGIKNKIPYLKKLGITALYLNPIFYGATVHKYDCLDYFTVDPHFGGDKALEDLSRELHKNGMKFIIDVSINHTGIANKWFNRDGAFFDKSYGAYNNPDSPEREYYFFNKDNTYKCWFDVKTLPTLNYSSDKLKKVLFLDKDSLVKKWLSEPYNADGWRFDVADTMARNDLLQLHHQVWPQIRNSIKETNPDSYILAEDWTDCTEFLNGNEWDSPMNYYSSCRPIRAFYGQVDFFNANSPDLKEIRYKLSAKDFASWIEKYYTRLPYVIRQNLFNLLDSHDISRFHNDIKMKKEWVKGAVIMIFTLPGCTNVYYGDEADIDGLVGSNEGCRYPMPWNKNIEETDSYKLYSTLAHLKQNEEAFSDGGFKFVWKKNGVIAFARFTDEKLYLTVCSNSDKNQKIKIDLRQFGTKIAESRPETKDLLGESFSSKVKNSIFTLKVPASKAFLIKL